MFAGTRGFTNRVCRVRPYPLAFREKGLVLFRKLGLLPGGSIVCAAGVAIGKVNNLQIRERDDLYLIDREKGYRMLRITRSTPER